MIQIRGVQLVEGLGDIVAEIVDDLYLARFGHDRDEPAFTRDGGNGARA